MHLNFGKNIELSPQRSYSPASEQEVLDILDRHRGQRIRVIGRLHSWSRIIETDDVLLDLRNLDQVEPSTEGGAYSVRVGAGCQIKRLLSELQIKKQWTLPSVGFITEQTMAGAISTGTHGSGKHSLSHYVLSVRIATYDTDSGKAVIKEVSDGVALQALRCSLGCLGVIVNVQMQCRNAYRIEESFHEYDKFSDVAAAEKASPLQQFYLVPWRWTYFVQHRREVNVPSSTLLFVYQWYRFLFLDIGLHLALLFAVRVLRLRWAIRAMIGRIVPFFVIQDWRVVGPSNTQMVMEHELFRHIELELFVQKSQLDSAMEYLQNVLEVAGGTTSQEDRVFQERIAGLGMADELEKISGSYCHHYPICIRKILVDDTLVSMASPSCRDLDIAIASESVHEPWYSITLSNFEKLENRRAFENVCQFLTRSMSQLFCARPHWGKLCMLNPEELRDLYPRFSEFRQVCLDYDSNRVFRNRWTDELLMDA